MNQMGCTQAKKEVFLYIKLFLRYFLSQSVQVAEVTGQQYRGVCQSSPSSGSGKGGFWSGRWVSPSGGHGGGTAMSTRCPVFLSLKSHCGVIQCPTAADCIQLHEKVSTGFVASKTCK